MATDHYKLPTVDPDSTLSFPDAVNGMANATDAVLKGISESFPTVSYELPTASSQTLGGVRIGEGFRIYSDGLLTTSTERFQLAPATNEKLGGVVIGKNIDVTDAGVISMGKGAVANPNITSTMLAPGAVTTEKIADTQIQQNQLDGDALNKLTGAQRVWLNATHVNFTDASGGVYTASVWKIANKLLWFHPNELVRPLATDSTPKTCYAKGPGGAALAPGALGFTGVITGEVLAIRAKGNGFVAAGLNIVTLNGDDSTYQRKYYDFNSGGSGTAYLIPLMHMYPITL